MHISRRALVAIYSSIPAPMVGMYMALAVYMDLTGGLASHADILNFAASLNYAACSAGLVGVMASALTAFALYSAVDAIFGPDATTV